MPRLEISANAREQISHLPHDRKLAKEIFGRLSSCAKCPELFTEPGCFPHSEKNQVGHFTADDSAGRSWGVTAVFRINSDVAVLRAIYFNPNAAAYPRG